MEHTYLRYECADSFGIVSSASPKVPATDANIALLDNILLTTAGSCCVGYHLRTNLPVLKLAHAEQSGGIGTGRALNSEEIVCLDVAMAASSPKVATGWVDGAVRVFFDIDDSAKDLVHSLLYDKSELQEPLVLNGHNGPVRVVAFDKNDVSRLASGGSDGSVVIWDVLDEKGLFRLLGHRGGITSIKFLRLSGLDGLVTTSLDSLIKIWNIQGQCCTQTIASHRGEVWGADLGSLWTEYGEESNNRWRLISGGDDGQLRVWSVKPPKRASMAESDFAERETEPDDLDSVCFFMGLLTPPPHIAASSEKIFSVQFHPSCRYVAVLRSNSKSIDVFVVRGVKESSKRRQRRLKRRIEKQKKKEESDVSWSSKKRGILDDDESSDDEQGDVAEGDERDIDPEAVKATDEFEYLTTVRCSHKIKSFRFLLQKEKKEVTRLVCALATNALETYAITRKIDSDKKQVVEAMKMPTLDIEGHPTGIRSVVLSSDDSLACTVSKNVTKIWKVDSRSCVQTFTPSTLSSSKSKASSYGLCAAFLPGNAHVVVGTREGSLILIDVAAGEVVFSEAEAHAGAVWSVDIKTPTNSESGISLVTGSADKSVKFWDIESSEEGHGDSSAEHPVLAHTRTIQMSDDVVAVRYSHSADSAKRLVFVSSLDSTIKVFFDDSLKLFLSLYGHKLPALSVDSSDDDVILASGGADKTVKIWGLDFGDTHRTLHGHEDSITDVRFIRRTHNFFTSSKDGTIRYWDGDRFEQILFLTGHSAEVNCLAVSRTGSFVLSGSMDRSIRIWERTKDIVFLEEEREREMEQIFDKVGRGEEGTASILARKDGDADDENDNIEDLDQPQSEAAVRKSIMSIAAGDRLMEGIERADQELKDAAIFKKSAATNAKRQPNPLLLGLQPAHYVLWILKSIKSAELEQSLLVLPLSHLERLMYYCTVLLRQGRGVEVCSRVAIFMVKVHQNQLVSNKSLATPLRELRRLIRLRVGENRDMVGYNLAAMKLIGREAQERRQSFLSGADSQPVDIWAGMAMGSDIAAALEGKPTRRKR